MMANVAQLVEPRFVVPVVVGSSPIGRPRDTNRPRKGCVIFIWKAGARTRKGSLSKNVKVLAFLSARAT